MKKIIILALAFFLVFDCAHAQRRYKKNKMKIQQISFGIGATNFLGELGGANKIGSGKINIRDFDFPSIRPNITIGYRYQFHKHWSTKAELNAAYIGGADRLTEETYRNNRNLNFRSPIVELSGRIEYIINFKKKGHQYTFKGIRGWRNFNINGYVFGGVAGFYFDPRGKLGGEWYRLKPLCTEGQGILPTRNTYSNFQLALPFGIGIHYAINKNWAIGLEYGARWTFTDYIDDVSLTYVDMDALRAAKGDLACQLSNPSPTASQPANYLYNSTLPGQQRGDPRDKDSYMFLSLSMYYNLDRGFTPKLRF
jgi:opacity protein-like surface antigen